MARAPEDITRAITRSGISIYDDLAADDPRYLDARSLEALLAERLEGLCLDYPIRTRAKVAKQAVCEALGYPSPSSFRKTRPRFPGQNFDLYVQKSDNLQIWNEDVEPTRRYVLVRLDSSDYVSAVRVLSGEELALLDRTGTLTSKFQASRRDDTVADRGPIVMASSSDTEALIQLLSPRDRVARKTLSSLSPVDVPRSTQVLTIRALCEKLSALIGTEIEDPGLDQERNRGAALHREVCKALGLGSYADKGQFPDVLSQALEVKLQTSPTIDLGLVSPDSEAPIDGLNGLRHCDMRYAVFYASKPSADRVRLLELVVSTGEAFFKEFRRFGGLVRNRKLQIPLPRGLFDPE